MPLKRLVKMYKITNRQMLLMNRREPHKPVMKDRQQIQTNTLLEAFERRCAEGTVFVPDEALPPWRRSILTNLKRTQNQMNIRGLRIRAVDRQDEPGFPTHFR